MEHQPTNAQVHEHSLRNFKIALLGILFMLASVATSAQQQYSISNTKAIKAYENAMNAFNARNSELALLMIDDAIKREANFIEAYLLRFEVLIEGGKIDEATQALRDAVAINPDFFPNAWYFLGSLELKQGHYTDAMEHLKRFKQYKGVNPELIAKAHEGMERCAYAIKAMENPVDFNPKNMGAAINSELPEYYPCLTADGKTLLYTRLRNDPQAFRGKNEDFFISIMEEGEWQPSVPLHGINTIYNEGAPAISADGKVLVFTACEIMGDYGPGRKGFGSCDLFIAYKVGNRWTTPENMGAPVNTRNWETQPSLTADGNTLYFVRGITSRSGIQNQDIFMCQREPDGLWSIPQPLGPQVNTTGKEESVMIHPDGQTLYFASNGHPGMGGMDLFVSRLQPDGHWGEATNLGYPINTHNDENSLHVGPDGRIALFASDRSGGFGELDLYSFELPVNAVAMAVTYAEGRVLDDATGAPLEASLELYELDGVMPTMNFSSDPVKGDFLVALPTGRTYGLSVRAKGYLFHSENFQLEQLDSNKPYQLEVRLKKPITGSGIVLRNVFFDTDKDVLKSASVAELGQLAELLKNNASVRIEISGHTDNQGDASYNKQLSLRRAEAVKAHLLSVHGIEASRITAKGFGTEQPIADNATEEGRALNRRTEFKIL